MSRSVPHCPACAATLPDIERQQILTCEFCGTDINADYQPAPMAPPRSPPLSRERTWSAEYEDPARWEPGAYVHAVLTAKDPADAIALATGGNGHLAGEDLLVWAPALAEGVIKAERAGHADLADHLAVLLSRGGSRRASNGIGEDSPEAIAARQGRRLRAGDFEPIQRVAPKDAWFALQIAERLLDEAPESPAGAMALVSAGPAALKRLLTLAAESEREGHDARLDDALACTRRILTETTDDWAFGVVFDAAAYLVPKLPPRTQQAVMDTLGDLADMAIDEPGRERGREWRGPDDILIVLLLYADDLLHEHPDLGRRFLAAVVKGCSRHPWERRRWALALRALPSAAGRAACLDAYEQVHHQRAEDAEDELIEEIGRGQDVTGWKPVLKGDLPGAVGVARARDGQAPCPACGRALTLVPDRLITACDHCGQASRVAREVRTIRRALDPESLDLHTWTPERLVRTMIDTGDRDLRLKIADELASATSDGARYAALAPALVTYMLADTIPEEVEDRLKDGIGSMLRFRDPEFLGALFDAIRAQAFTEEGSDRLLLALEKAGPVAAPLLFDLCDKVTDDANAWGHYALRAKQVAMTVLERCGEEDLEAQTEFLLGRMQRAGAALSDEIPVALGNQCFDRELPLGPAQRRVILFIDEHTDPAKVSWMKGMAHHAPDLSMPHYCWTAQDVAGAERRTGLKWAQGGELDTNRILMAIPTLAGSRVSLRQVDMLMSQVGQWNPPPTGVELLERLKLAQQCRLESTRVLILSRMTERPKDLDPAGEAEVRAALASLRGLPNATRWVEFVERVLTTPGHAKAVTAKAAAAWRPPRQLGLMVRLKWAWGTRKWPRFR